jgi:hypothetical protein
MDRDAARNVPPTCPSTDVASNPTDVASNPLMSITTRLSLTGPANGVPEEVVKRRLRGRPTFAVALDAGTNWTFAVVTDVRRSDRRSP